MALHRPVPQNLSGGVHEHDRDLIGAALHTDADLLLWEGQGEVHPSALAGRQRERQEWRSSRFKQLQWSLASGHLGEPFLALSVAATPLESIAPRAKSTPPKGGPSGGAEDHKSC